MKYLLKISGDTTPTGGRVFPGWVEVWIRKRTTVLRPLHLTGPKVRAPAVTGKGVTDIPRDPVENHSFTLLD